MNRFLLWAFLTWPVLAVAPGFAALKDLYVICNPALAIGAEELQDVFVGEKQFAGGTRLVPVDNAAAQTDFLAKVVTIDGKKYRSIWVKKSFRDGLAIPPVKSGDAEVIAFVRNTPGGVGYVGSPPPAEVKTVGKF
jgi:hypothetical protein